jgi:anti-anti-sigma factor
MTVAVADVSADNGSVCIRLSGEIDRANVSAVEEQIRAAVSGQRIAVSVDLVNVIYIDSTGKQLLFDLALLLRDRILYWKLLFLLIRPSVG